MAREVIKRKGKRAPFKADKIKKSILSALRDVHITGAKAKRMAAKAARPVLKLAAKRKAIKTSTIRKYALQGLRKVEPKAAKAWIKYDARRRARRRR